MRSGKVAIAAALLCAATGLGPSVGGRAQPADQEHGIPQSMRLEQQETIEQLTILAQRPPPVGPAAQQALARYQEHTRLEEEFIFPPLALSHEIADGHVTPDMKWAIAMADRVKAEREKIFEEDTRVTDAMNDLASAAETAHDDAAYNFARAVVADLLIDLELREPMTIIIGDYLRMKLRGAQ